MFSSTSIALGLVILARGGGFAKYSSLLIGDVLAVTQNDLIYLAVALVLGVIAWAVMYNALLFTGINASLARSRGIPVRLTEYAFAVLLAVAVMLAIRWVGVMLINALLILPAAAGRNLARNARRHAAISVLIALVCGIAGLLSAYYWDTSAGAAHCAVRCGLLRHIPGCPQPVQPVRRNLCMSDFTSIKQWLKSTEDEPLETMSGFFDRRVDSYEDHMRPWRAYYRWLGELIPAQAETLLDLGCGTGLELDEIFRLHPDIRVTGIDLAPGMLARLREKHPERKLTLTVGDYLTVPLAPCAFDVAVAFETLHHFPPETKLGLFRRIFAALRPGGMLLEGDYIAESDEMETYLFQELARRRARQHVPEGTFVHFDTPLTLAHELSLLSQAGFTAEVLGYRGEDNTPMIRAIKP